MDKLTEETKALILEKVFFNDENSIKSLQEVSSFHEATGPETPVLNLALLLFPKN